MMRILLTIFLLLTLLVPTGASAQMTQDMRDHIVSEHNRMRSNAVGPGAPYEVSSEKATAMLKMEYDMGLECVAQRYLDNHPPGPFQPNPDNFLDYKQYCGGNGDIIGENWASTNPDSAVFLWTDRLWPFDNDLCSERQSFHQSPEECSGGPYMHYTQVMWANTYKVGCGYTSQHGTVCNYHPSGNWVGQQPFVIGEACSACPYTHPFCTSEGLCSSTNETVYSVIASVLGGNGSIAPASQNVTHGEEANFVVNPAANHHIDSISGDTCIVTGSGTSYSAANITGDCTVSVSFAINQYTVTANVSGGNGSISPATQSVKHGDVASFTVNPDTGYHIDSISGDTCIVTARGNSYSAAAITQPCTVTVSFAINQYTVTAGVVGGNGSITPASQTVAHGGTAEFAVTPEPGFIVEQLAGDHCTPGNYGPDGWKAQITANCHVTAKFQALADLWADLSIQSVPVFPGDRMVLGVSAGNHGPQPATGAQLSWPTPTGLQDVHWTCEASASTECPQAQGTGDIHFALDLPVDASLLFLVDAEVLPGTGSHIETSASISAGNEHDPDLGNNPTTLGVFIEGIFRDGLE